MPPRQDARRRRGPDVTRGIRKDCGEKAKTLDSTFTALQSLPTPSSVCGRAPGGGPRRLHAVIQPGGSVRDGEVVAAPMTTGSQWSSQNTALSPLDLSLIVFAPLWFVLAFLRRSCDRSRDRKYSYLRQRKGIVLNEPRSWRSTGTPRGSSHRQGSPGNAREDTPRYRTIRPMKDGVIADFEMAEGCSGVHQEDPCQLDAEPPDRCLRPQRRDRGREAGGKDSRNTRGRRKCT